MSNCKGVLDLPSIWYKGLTHKKKEELNKKLLKDWKIKWDDCSETLKSVIYYKERGK